MKYRMIVVLLMLMGFVQAMAMPVDRATAHSAAVKFWNTYRPQTVEAVDQLTVLELNELQHLYVFADKEQEGFVIVAGDDCVQPILGYSFDAPFPVPMHASIAEWLGEYDAYIEVLQGREGYGDVEKSSEWGKLLTSTVPDVPVSLVMHSPMLKTRWNQSAPYNNMCPEASSGERTVVGCVATAMSQIMKYWNHPSCGTGSLTYSNNYGWQSPYGPISADFGNTTYVWSNMNNALSMFATQRQITPVAMLCYHAGVSVKMMYGTSASGGSGAYSSDVVSAMRDYFRYNENLHMEYRNQYDSLAWANMIDDDLLAHRPIYYTGRDESNGHAFVLDGADSMGRYHFNWGWGGYGDGYYTLNNMSPGGSNPGSNSSGTYNLSQSAIFGIRPIPQTFDSVAQTDTFCTNSRYYDFYEHSILAVDTTYVLTHLETVYTVSLVGISGQRLFLEANNGNGQNMMLDYCPAVGAVFPQNTFRRPGWTFVGWGEHIDGHGNVYQPGDVLRIYSDKTYYALWRKNSGIDDVEVYQASIYPNPVCDVMTIKCPSITGAMLYIYDQMGRKVMEKAWSGDSAEINVSNFSAGVYTVEIVGASGRAMSRIIKK
ncbi:MAG: thiol protease/hemagglutinin PrtT [Bacteroidales bacterium]|nr:thiol protease/hemagglutinin PrtT [Bacteroidales bacterium]